MLYFSSPGFYVYTAYNMLRFILNTYPYMSMNVTAAQLSYDCHYGLTAVVACIRQYFVNSPIMAS